MPANGGRRPDAGQRAAVEARYIEHQTTEYQEGLAHDIDSYRRDDPPRLRSRAVGQVRSADLSRTTNVTPRRRGLVRSRESHEVIFRHRRTVNEPISERRPDRLRVSVGSPGLIDFGVVGPKRARQLSVQFSLDRERSGNTLGECRARKEGKGSSAAA